MKNILIFLLVQIAMIATGFWEAYSEGRNSWGKGKLGWKIKIAGYELTAYHFYLFFVMFPALLAIPLVVAGWETRLFGVLVSAYAFGLVVEDFTWYIVNPEVELREFFTEFSDYYPWIRVGKNKLIPTFYVLAIALSVISWILLWK